MLAISDVVGCFVIRIDLCSVPKTKLDSAYQVSVYDAAYALTRSVLQIPKSARNIL